MHRGAATSIRPVCCKPMSCPMPAGRSTRSRSTARFTGCNAPMPLPGGTTRPRRVSSSPSRARALSPTSGGCAISKPRLPISSPRASCGSRRSSVPCCGNSRRAFASLPSVSTISSHFCRETPMPRRPSPKAAASGSPTAPGPRPRSGASCDTRSRSATRASSTRPSWRCCAGTGWRWSSPTRWRGPMPRM